MVALVASFICFAIAVVALHSYIGWEEAVIAGGIVAVGIAGLMFVVERRNSRLQNPFRVYLTSSPEELTQALMNPLILRQQ